MKRYINQTRVATVKALASASLIGLMSVGVAYGQTQPTNKKDIASDRENIEKKVSNQELQVIPSAEIFVEETSDSEVKNTQMVFNEIGFRVPKSHYEDKN